MNASAHILGMRVDLATYAEATRQVAQWAAQGDSRSVCCANVHMAMECFDDPAYRAIVNAADLVTPDGVPLVWTQRALGHRTATRVYGPDLMRAVLAEAERRRLAVGFYGATNHTLDRLIQAVLREHPRLDIRYATAPPFRALSEEEDRAVVAAIGTSRAQVLFVGLGCPKQERWIHNHRGRVNAVMLGVGAAFDFIAGVKPQAPPVLQRAGLEWLFRLTSEPERLWRRYLTNNPRFLLQVGAQLLRARMGTAAR